MNKEIEIPYGYEARIECNKVILEPMEGDDERIRKEIIFAILSGRVYDTDLIGAEHIFELDKEVADKWLAYLKPKPKFNVGDTIRLKNSYAEYTIESISDGRYYCKGCSIDIDGGNRDYELVRQKPTEWSDKDESYLQTVISEMEANKKEAQVYEHKNYDAIILWLKSLRPQPKAEWSDEDESKKERLISIVKGALHGNKYPILNDDGATELITWLKSLRPHPHWKSSDEQIMAPNTNKEKEAL